LLPRRRQFDALLAQHGICFESKDFDDKSRFRGSATTESDSTASTKKTVMLPAAPTRVDGSGVLAEQPFPCGLIPPLTPQGVVDYSCTSELTRECDQDVLLFGAGALSSPVHNSETTTKNRHDASNIQTGGRSAVQASVRSVRRCEDEEPIGDIVPKRPRMYVDK
jgi:hypothetical protein